jgi:hypothetical protein
MNLEFTPIESTEASQPVRDYASPPSRQASGQDTSGYVKPRSASVLPGTDDEFDDAIHFKTPTLNIDLLEDASEGMVSAIASQTRTKYVQGIVQGGQVYIITNLLGGESQMVIQPQMVWTLGRNREVALPIRDKSMSRRHAVILHVPGVGFYLIDLNSMNGSYVNWVRIKHRHLLNDGDRVRIGSTEFIFLTSQRQRFVEAMHPEILARLTASKAPLGQHIDFLALEEPELSFTTLTRK